VRTSSRTLGLLYFGWVGAVSCDRLSMPGAEAAARRYLPAFRAEQRRLRVSDAALCALVEGDCPSRLVRMQADEAVALPAPDAGRPTEGYQLECKNELHVPGKCLRR
jgi:hypothetical protein